MEDNIYGTGLRGSDWQLFHGILLDHLHTSDPAAIKLRKVPDDLTNHEFMELINSYRETGRDTYLDRAGKVLLPDSKGRFGWYVALTK